MIHPLPFKLNTRVMLLAPTFLLIAACGAGGGDEADQADTARPASYAPEMEVMSAENTAIVDADAVPAEAAADAANPADTSNDAASSATTPGAHLLAAVQTSDDLANAAKTDAATPLATRDPLKQPFASNSIWNTPIGSNAVYVAANLKGNPGANKWAKMPGVDDEHIVLKPTAPMTAINKSTAGWGGNRCAATGGLLVSVPIPGNYTIPSSSSNSSAAFLLADKRTIVQAQPVARCSVNGPATALVKFSNVDLYGPGITGSHGGSGMSALGGSIRLGELRPGQTGPKHALKLNVYAKEALYRCTTRAQCSRWPAVTSDSYAVGWYGTANNNGNSNMKMGALLAIPASRSIASLGLETEPARQLAWTLQNYGAYIVDDTYAPGFFLNAEVGADGSVMTQFRNDYGYAMEQKVVDNTAWVRDTQRLAQALAVVANNSATSVGGGGTPRQPLAPPIAP